MKNINIKISKKEIKALHDAFEYVTDILHGCMADEDTKEGKTQLNLLNNTIDGIGSLIDKVK